MTPAELLQLRVNDAEHALLEIRRALALPEPPVSSMAKLGAVRRATITYLARRWGRWLLNHPECQHHGPGHTHHDALQDPNGCGHCVRCHDDLDPDGPTCGHTAGCPGC